jgi:hypothetical protein
LKRLNYWLPASAEGDFFELLVQCEQGLTGGTIRIWASQRRRNFGY